MFMSSRNLYLNRPQSMGIVYRCGALLLCYFFPEILAFPDIPSLTQLPNPVSYRPRWAANEVDACDYRFSYGHINPQDCLTALESLPAGPDAVRFTNNNHWQHESTTGLPLIITQGTCAIKFETSGRNALSLSSILVVPNNIRQMASWIMAECVLASGRVGFVTRDIDNTRNYLNNPNVDADFEAGFREPFLSPNKSCMRLILTLQPPSPHSLVS